MFGNPSQKKRGGSFALESRMKRPSSLHPTALCSPRPALFSAAVLTSQIRSSTSSASTQSQPLLAKTVKPSFFSSAEATVALLKVSPQQVRSLWSVDRYAAPTTPIPFEEPRHDDHEEKRGWMNCRYGDGGWYTRRRNSFCRDPRWAQDMIEDKLVYADQISWYPRIDMLHNGKLQIMIAAAGVGWRSPLHFLETDHVNSDIYWKWLSDHVVPHLRREDKILVHDHATWHMSKKMLGYLEQESVPYVDNFPKESPDLLMIRPLMRQLRLHRDKSKEELQRVWDCIPQRLVDEHMRHFKRQRNAISRCNGALAPLKVAEPMLQGTFVSGGDLYLRFGSRLSEISVETVADHMKREVAQAAIVEAKQAKEDEKTERRKKREERREQKAAESIQKEAREKQREAAEIKRVK